jgi:hypothetical protein
MVDAGVPVHVLRKIGMAAPADWAVTSCPKI